MGDTDASTVNAFVIVFAALGGASGVTALVRSVMTAGADRQRIAENEKNIDQVKSIIAHRDRVDRNSQDIQALFNKVDKIEERIDDFKTAVNDRLLGRGADR